MSSYRRLFYEHKINAPGQHRFEVATRIAGGGDNPVAALLGDDGNVDYQLEFWRSDLDAGITPYLDFESFHRTGHRYQKENGDESVVSYGRGYNDLLAGREIAYYSGTPQAEKAGPGETVIKSYVEQNLGPSALVANGRYASGVAPGFVVSGDAARGDPWTGARANRNLLEVCQEIGHCVGGLDFFIIGTGPGTFEFQVGIPQWGSDRSTAGLDPTTGLNSFGNTPVVFSVGYANMLVPQYSISHAEERNRIYALGQGIGSERVVHTKEDAAQIGASPWALREASYNANTESTAAGLETVATARLHELEPRKAFDFVALQTAAVRYGRDYFLGDIVTARYANVEVHRKIIGVSVTVDMASNKEDLRLEISHVE